MFVLGIYQNKGCQVALNYQSVLIGMHRTSHSESKGNLIKLNSFDHLSILLHFGFMGHLDDIQTVYEASNLVTWRQ